MIMPKNKLVWLLVIPFALTIIGIDYGLPMHFIGDEESLIGGAMKMLELRNVVPATEPETFAFFYYPPVLGYSIILAAIPVMFIKFLTLGFSFSALQDFFALHQNLIWLSARVMTALVSTGMIAVTYSIARRLFGARVAFFAAVTLALSFFHIVLSHWMRHWMYTAFFAYLTFLLGMVYTEKRQKKYAWLSAFVAGVGFGASYVSILGFGATLVYWWRNRVSAQGFVGLVLKASAIVVIVGGILSMLNFPELVRIISPVDGTLSHPKSIMGFVNFFEQFVAILWNQELVISILVIASLYLLWCRYRRFLSVVIVSLVGYNAILYVFFHLELRYVYFIIPLLSIAAALVLQWIYSFFGRRWLAISIMVLILAWPAATVVQYVRLLIKPDTREQAVKWIEKNIGNELFILSSATIELPRIREAITLDIEYGSVRAKERYLLKHTDINDGVFNYVNMHFWEDEEEIEGFITKYQPVYAIIDYWKKDEDIDDREQYLIDSGTLVARFTQSSLAGELIDPNGNFYQFNNVLFKLNRMGPQVEIYQINKK